MLLFQAVLNVRIQSKYDIIKCNLYIKYYVDFNGYGYDGWCKMKICPNCSVEYEDKYAFCHQCGGKLQEKIEQNFCPFCGNKVETDGEFCPFCGNSLEETGSSISNNVIKTSVEIQRQENTKEAVLPEAKIEKNYVKMTPLQGSEDKSNDSETNDKDSELSYGWWDAILLLVGALLTKGLVKGHAPLHYHIVTILAVVLLCIIGHLIGNWIKKKFNG